MEKQNKDTPSFNPESGQQYIYNAARAAAERSDTLWQVDDAERTIAAASTRESDNAIIIENIGSLVKGKGRELLKQIAEYAIAKGKQVEVSATFDSEEYYMKIGFVPIEGRNNIWTIDPHSLL